MSNRLHSPGIGDVDLSHGQRLQLRTGWEGKVLALDRLLHRFPLKKGHCKPFFLMSPDFFSPKYFHQEWHWCFWFPKLRYRQHKFDLTPPKFDSNTNSMSKTLKGTPFSFTKPRASGGSQPFNTLESPWKPHWGVQDWDFVTWQCLIKICSKWENHFVPSPTIFFPKKFLKPPPPRL